MDIKFKNELIDYKQINLDDYIIVDKSHFKINDGIIHRNCFVAEDEKHIFAFIDGKTFHFEKADEQPDFGDNSSGSAGNRDEIKPPMPGSVVKILVESGQTIEEGQGVIIVEAMKMETTIYSSIAGTVKQVNVAAGEQVDSDKIMILIEKDE